MATAWFRTHAIAALLLAMALPGRHALAGGASGMAAADVAVAASNARAPVTLKYDRFVLANGLTVLVYTDRSVPTIHVGLRYRTGSRDEPLGKHGYAHLFEHLMFQATAHRGGEFFTPLRRAGATGMNGSTDLDTTNYFETVPTGAIDLALWLESDRMGYLDGGITQPLLDAQRAVVENEKRQGELQTGAAVQERFLTGFYPAGHPYAHTTIGAIADLDHATLDDVKTWFRDHYGAANAVLVLAGDIDGVTAREKVTRYFAGIRAGPAIDRPLRWSPGLTDIRRDVVHDHFDAESFSRSWAVDNDDPRATTLMLLLARMLAGASDTALQKSLVEDAKVATGVSAEFTEHALSSTFTISLTLAPGVSAETAGKTLDTALADFIKREPDPDRLRTVVAASDTAILRTLESNAAVADFMLDGEIDHGDPAFFLQQRRWIGQVAPGDLRALAARWLQRPYFELRMLPLPAPAAPVADVDRSRLPTTVTTPRQITFPPITTMRLPNGMTLVVAERRRAPIVDIALRVASGTAIERGYAPGTAGAAFDMLLAGAGRDDAAALARRSAASGADIAVVPGDHESTISWSGRAGDLDRTFALAAQVLRHANYPADALARRAADTSAQHDAMARDPMAAADAIFARTVWGGARAADIDAPPPRADIVRFHDTEIGPQGATLFMIGDITPAMARAATERWFGDWRQATPAPRQLRQEAVMPRLSPPQPAVHQSEFRSSVPRRRIILIDAPGAAQSRIVLGNLTLPFAADRSATESLIDAALGGGFESRLNLAMRDKGWSYGFTGGIADQPTGPRLFTASGTVETAHTADAIAELNRQIADFGSIRPIEPDELEGVRSAAIQAVPLSFAGNDAFLAAMMTSSAYGLPYDRSADATVRLAAVTLDQARRAAAELYRADTLTWVIAGDLSRIEPGIRALGLAPVEIRDTAGRLVR